MALAGTAADRTKPAAIVAICFAVAALEGYDIQAFGVAAPKLVAELSLDAGQMGWAASVAMLGLVLGAFVGGWLA
ncbi:3-(3-hydroxy-phenyl)propionate transporter MhpT, partial [Acinetobacter baumannii]